MHAPPELRLHAGCAWSDTRQSYTHHADTPTSQMLCRATAAGRTRDQVLFRYSYSELKGGLKTSSWVSCPVTSANRVYVSIPSPRKPCCAIRSGCRNVLREMPSCKLCLASLARCEALHKLQDVCSPAPLVQRTVKAGRKWHKKRTSVTALRSAKLFARSWLLGGSSGFFAAADQ